MVLKNLQDMDNLSSPNSHKVQTPNLSKSKRHFRLSTVSTSSISETAMPYHRLTLEIHTFNKITEYTIKLLHKIYTMNAKKIRSV